MKAAGGSIMLERVGARSRSLGGGSPLDVVEPSALGRGLVDVGCSSRAVPGANVRREDADVSGLDVVEPRALATAGWRMRAPAGAYRDDLVISEDMVLAEPPVAPLTGSVNAADRDDGGGDDAELPVSAPVSAPIESPPHDGDDLGEDALTEEGMLLFLLEEEDAPSAVDPAFRSIDQMASQVDLESLFAARARRQRMRAQAAARTLPPIAAPPARPSAPWVAASPASPPSGSLPDAAPSASAPWVASQNVFAGPEPTVSPSANLDDGPAPWAERPRRRTSLLPGRAPR
jgi:hypothetical protein